MRTTADKAATHKVTPSPKGFKVISGTSGKTYLVVPLGTGGAACNCPCGRHSGRIAVACSHVKAVEAFAADALDAGRPEALQPDPFWGFREPGED